MTTASSMGRAADLALVCLRRVLPGSQVRLAFCRRLVMLLLPATVALVPALGADIAFSNLTKDWQIAGGRGNPGNIVDVALYSNSEGVPFGAPETLLASLGSSAVISGDLIYSARGPIPSGLMLSSGVQYWRVLTPCTAQTAVDSDGNLSSFRPFELTADVTGASGWINEGAGLEFQITGTLVAAIAPEPTSIALLGGVLLFSGSRLRERVC